MPLIAAALDDLQLARASSCARRTRDVRIGFDLADLERLRATTAAPASRSTRAASSDAIARGGRYDEVGAVFGRNRPAVGFSLDLKELAALAPAAGAARGDPRALGRGRRAARSRCAQLREQGETVVRVLPGHEHEAQEFDCDRELVAVDGRWLVRAL